MWQWFLKYGDKAFGAVSAVLALLISMKMVAGTTAQWVAFTAAALTSLHMIFLPEPAATNTLQQGTGK